MARAKRQPTPGDMIRTLAVILVPVVLIALFFTRTPSAPPVTVVDVAPVLAKAREQAPFPVLAPVGLPTGWRPTAVDWVQRGEPYLSEAASVRNRWRLGYLSPEDVYVAVTQADLQPAPFVKDVTRGGLPDGSSTVAGATWERRISPDERTRSLVQSSAAVTTVVAGDTSYETLEQFAGTLKPG